MASVFRGVDTDSARDCLSSYNNSLPMLVEEALEEILEEVLEWAATSSP